MAADFAEAIARFQDTAFLQAKGVSPDDAARFVRIVTDARDALALLTAWSRPPNPAAAVLAPAAAATTTLGAHPAPPLTAAAQAPTTAASTVAAAAAAAFPPQWPVFKPAFTPRDDAEAGAILRSLALAARARSPGWDEAQAAAPKELGKRKPVLDHPKASKRPRHAPTAAGRCQAAAAHHVTPARRVRKQRVGFKEEEQAERPSSAGANAPGFEAGVPVPDHMVTGSIGGVAIGVGFPSPSAPSHGQAPTPGTVDRSLALQALSLKTHTQGALPEPMTKAAPASSCLPSAPAALAAAPVSLHLPALVTTAPPPAPAARALPTEFTLVGNGSVAALLAAVTDADLNVDSSLGPGDREGPQTLAVDDPVSMGATAPDMLLDSDNMDLDLQWDLDLEAMYPGLDLHSLLQSNVGPASA